MIVTLTPRNPRVDCTFTNTFTPEPTPPTPPTPTPPPNPDPEPVAEVHVTKTADRQVVEVGGIITYTIKVSNTGKVAAHDIVLAEQTPVANATIVSLAPSRGTCQFTHAPATCDLGTIDAGETVTIIAKLRATHPGPLPNNVAVNSGSDVVNPPTAGVEGESVAHTRPRPRPTPKPTPKPPPFTG